MTDDEATRRCDICGESFPAADIGRGGLCSDCRRRVVRRATLVARVVAVLGAMLIAVFLATIVQPAQRFLLLWVVLVIGVYMVLFTLTRRVAFEVIRNRRTRIPEDLE